MSTGPKSNVSGSVFRALSLLEFVLGAEDPPTTRELSERFSIPSSSLAALMAALRGENYVTVRGGAFSPGTRLMAMGQLAGRHQIVANIRRALQLLVDRTRETAFYSIEVRGTDGGLGSVLPVEQIESPDEIRYVGILGRPTPLLRSMAGRVMLAFSDRDDEVRRAVAVTSGDAEAAAMLVELEQIRRTGIAWSGMAPVAIGTMTVATPVVREGRPVGALSIAGPAERIHAVKDELPDIFRRAQEIIGEQASAPVDLPRPGQALRWHSSAEGLELEPESRAGRVSLEGGNGPDLPT